MNRKAMIGSIALIVTLSACGKVGPLEPSPGQAPPAKAYGQEKVPGSEELMTPSEQARPGRSDELMKRSERRVNDPFDLPPGSDGDKEKQPPPSAKPATSKPQ
jgi:predicted small lipoprotein YifL